MTQTRAELAMPVLLAVIGLAALVGGLGYGMTDDAGRVGTGFLPALSGGALAALAVVDLLTTRRKQTHVEAGEADIPDDDLDIHGRSGAQRVRALVAVAVLVVLAVALVPVIGFLLSFAALLAVITMGVEKMGVLTSVLVTAVALALIWAVFVQFLSVPLPQGMLGLI